MMIIYISIALSLVALISAGIISHRILKEKIKNEKAKEIASIINKGTIEFLNKEYKALAILIVVVGAILYFLVAKSMVWSFICGAIFCGVATNIAVRIAGLCNVRAIGAAKKNFESGLKTVFRGGNAIGMATVGIGMMGVGLLYLIFADPYIIFGFGLGALIVTIFIRIGSSIYIKAADIGADLVSKIELGISEDDYRNPATLLDNIGDNVINVAGTSADLFDTYTNALIAALAIGALAIFESTALPLILAGLGMIATIFSRIIVSRIKRKISSPSKILNQEIIWTIILVAVFSIFIIKFITGQFMLFWPFLVGLLSIIAINFSTEFFTSYNHKPTQKLAASNQTGSVTNILKGFSLGMQGALVLILIILLAIFLSYLFGGIYGIAISAIGMLSALSIILGALVYDPIVDNAAGIAQTSELDEGVKSRINELIIGKRGFSGKGLAVGASILTTLVLLINYFFLTNLKNIGAINYKIIIALFIGGFLPFLFSGFLMSSVGRTTSQIIQEVRRQFKKIEGLKEGISKPDYARCMAIINKIATKEIIFLTAIAIIVPVIVGFFLGAEALAGLLATLMVTGFLLATTLINSGMSWDSAKKYIEAGNLGGVGSEAHKVSIVGDTIGDSFKDVVGPSLNSLLKLIVIISLIIAPLL